MLDTSKRDPARERAAATEAMEATPISGKEHEYRADGDHHPRQDAAAVGGGETAPGQASPEQDAGPEPRAPTARHISQGIPGGGESVETD